jgi:hypothetical protein
MLYGDDCSDGKRSKERITVALAASLTGEKLKPFVSAKSSNPRCFKNIKAEKLPVHFRDNKKAWMTAELMSLAFYRGQRHEQDRRKILLF